MSKPSLVMAALVLVAALAIATGAVPRGRSPARPNMAYQCAENLKLNRATVAGIKSNPTARFYGRIKFNPATFDVDALVHSGK